MDDFPVSKISFLCFIFQSWDIFFRNANAGAAPGTAYQSPPPLSTSLSTLTHAQSLLQAQPNVDKLVEDHLAVQSLIRAYQVRLLHLSSGDGWEHRAFLSSTAVLERLVLSLLAELEPEPV